MFRATLKNTGPIKVMITLVSFKGWFNLLRFAKSVKCKAHHVYVILNGISLLFFFTGNSIVYHATFLNYHRPSQVGQIIS